MARQRREQLDDLRIEKVQFDMLKWELYRLKCEDIEDRYAEFKKRQLKILWWNQIIARHAMAKKAKWNFDEHLKKVIHDAQVMIKAFRIQYRFRSYMKRHAPTKQRRDQKKVKK